MLFEPLFIKRSPQPTLEERENTLLCKLAETFPVADPPVQFLFNVFVLFTFFLFFPFLSYTTTALKHVGQNPTVAFFLFKVRGDGGKEAQEL